MTRSVSVALPIGVQTTAEMVTLPSGAAFQVCRTTVVRAQESTVHITLVLDATGGALPTVAELAIIEETLDTGDIVAGLRIPEPGKAIVSSPTAPSGADEDVAMVAAVCAASWGWDESPSIHVIVNGRGRDVTASFRDHVWTATVA